MWSFKQINKKRCSKTFSNFCTKARLDLNHSPRTDSLLNEFISYPESEKRILLCEIITACLLLPLAVYLTVAYSMFVISNTPSIIKLNFLPTLNGSMKIILQ